MPIGSRTNAKPLLPIIVFMAQSHGSRQGIQVTNVTLIGLFADSAQSFLGLLNNEGDIFEGVIV